MIKYIQRRMNKTERITPEKNNKSLGADKQNGITILKNIKAIKK